MLDELIVANFGLIEEARLEPGPGLVVVTGETGTGKTMLLGALRLLMGAPGRKDLVGPVSEEATVQARFALADGEALVARRLSRSGRSKAYIDGLMTPVKALEERTSGVVELVAQHDHLRLRQSAEVRALLDAELDASGRAALEAHRTAWERLVHLRRRQADLGGDRRALQRELEAVRHQATEIRAARFTEGEDDAMDVRVRKLRNAQGILEALDAAASDLGEEGAEGSLHRIVLALQRATILDPTLDDLAAQAADVASLLGELRIALAAAAAEVVVEPGELDDVEQRLALLGELRRKYGASLAEVLAFADAAEARAAELTALLEEAETLDEELEGAEANVRETAQHLTAARRRIADRLAAEALRHLRELGFAAPVLFFGCEAAPPGPEGGDRWELRFASDEKLEPGPIGRIASGGELSRLVLALRLAATGDAAGVAAFDEIDAGVGGAAALALASKLADLARHRQVLCVTHLPQIAARADTHYVVSRSDVRAVVTRVEGEQRIEELTRMLSGMPESERGRQHAAELLAAAAEAPA